MGATTLTLKWTLWTIPTPIQMTTLTVRLTMTMSICVLVWKQMNAPHSLTMMDSKFAALTSTLMSVIRVESRGIYGRGNFDEGYTSAQQDAEKAKSSLNLIVGVMGAVIGMLVLCIAGGAFFVFHRGHGKIVDMEEEEESRWKCRIWRKTSRDSRLILQIQQH